MSVSFFTMFEIFRITCIDKLGFFLILHLKIKILEGMMVQDNKSKCLDIINERFNDYKGSDKGINPNINIGNQDKLACKLYAYIVGYDIKLVDMIINSSNGIQDIAKKGLLELSLIAGIKGWTPE